MLAVVALARSRPSRIFVATQPVDGRKGPDSLMALVRDVLRHDPFSGHLFIFFSIVEVIGGDA